jgi:hypothetical protein
MNNKAYYIFLDEAKNQCDFALMAVDQMNDGLNKLNSKLFWYAIHGFLSAAGNLSKILNRASTLSEHLGVDKDHIIFDRKFRNHWEHFDERIDTWASNPDNRIYMDSYIGMKELIEQFCHDKGGLRNYETDTGCLRFAGDRLELQKLIDAICVIKDNLDKTIIK